MPSILNLIPHATGQPQDDVATGTLSLFQPAPSSFQSPLFVVIDGWSTDHYVKVTKWWAGNGLARPQPGCEVTLLKDGAGAWVCVWWDGIVPTATGTHGETAGYSAGVGTAVTIDGATTGGLGATAYTLGDMVRTFKELGILPH